MAIRRQTRTDSELKREAVRLMRSGLPARAVRRQLRITYTKLIELTANETLTLRKSDKSG